MLSGVSASLLPRGLLRVDLRTDAHLFVNNTLAIGIGHTSAVLGVDALLGIHALVAMMAVCSDCWCGGPECAIGFAAAPIQDPFNPVQKTEAHNSSDDTWTGRVVSLVQFYW